MRAGQAAHTCDVRERECGSGPLRRSRLPGRRLTEARRGDATPPETIPPDWLLWERGGEMPSGRADPHGILGIPARTGRSITEVGSRSRGRVYPGLTRDFDSYRGAVRLVRTSRRGSTPSTRPLQAKPMGASGRGRWRQRPRLRTRQRSKALRPAAASGVVIAVRSRRRPAAATCNGEKAKPVGDDGTAADEGNASKGRA